MSRRSWAQLPADVRTAVEQHAGPVEQMTAISGGAASDLVAVLHTRTGDVVCKGASLENPAAWTHRREAYLNPHMPKFAPRLRWHVETGGWIVNGFDRAPGRHINLIPGSPDLPVLADTLATMSTMVAPPVRIQAAGVRWGEWLTPEQIDGETLVHADVSHQNFLIDGTRIAVIDWATPVRGAAWIDSALTVVRLIRAGHTAAAAEEWAAQIPAWADAPQDSVTAFARAYASKLARQLNTSPAAHLSELAAATASWIALRSGAFTSAR